MACAAGNITRLFTRNCYGAIECRSSWDQPLHVFPEARYEFSFRLNNIDSINGKVMSPKSSAVGVVYSDASDSGFWWLFRAVRLGFSVRCLVPRGKVKVKVHVILRWRFLCSLESTLPGSRRCAHFTPLLMRSSSTFREILAVKFVLLSLVNQLSGLTRFNGLRTMKMYLGLFRLEVVKVICSPKLCLYLVSAVVMAFRSKWNGSQDRRMIRLIFSVVFLIQTTGAFLHFRFTTFCLSLGSSFCRSFHKSCECQTPSFQVNILESRF